MIDTTLFRGVKQYTSNLLFQLKEVLKEKQQGKQWKCLQFFAGQCTCLQDWQDNGYFEEFKV